jgi:hypothetical protein
MSKQIDAINKAIEATLSKLADLEAKKSKLEVEAEEEAATAAARAKIELVGLPVGTEVTFSFGRKDNRKEFTGKVLAFRPAADTLPAAYKVETGTGFDADIKVVPARDVNPVVA